jgi:hypothetical protein
MAAPNLFTTSTVTGKTSLTTLSTVTSNIITNASGSNTVYKLNNILLSNYTSSTTYANVLINRSSSSYYLGGNVAIPGNSTLVLLGKDIALYIEEGDTVQANVSANSSISMAASYELLG